MLEFQYSDDIGHCEACQMTTLEGGMTVAGVIVVSEMPESVYTGDSEDTELIMGEARICVMCINAMKAEIE